MNSRTTLFAVATVTVLGAFYLFHSSPTISPGNMTGTTGATKGVPGLESKLSQISRNPPSLLVTLKNNGPTPFTILRWGTPLDPQAANQGLFKLVDEETGEEVPVAVVKFARKMPPQREDLVTIAPGTEEATEVVFDKPWMPTKKPAKYKVKVEGTFGGIWDRYGDAVTEGDLEAYTASPFNGKAFGSNEVEMRVE